DALKKTWCSAVYSFFKLDAVTVQYLDGRLVHFFPCGARKCKLPAGGVRRFQDSKDKSSTMNLRHHTNGCWGKEAVDHAFSGGKVVQATSGSVFSAFARKGQQPVHHTYRMHTSNEVRANLVRWITENNRPVNIINDRALRDLLLSGRPNIELPSHFTISRDIWASFEKCQERIGTLLQVCDHILHCIDPSFVICNYPFNYQSTPYLAFSLQQGRSQSKPYPTRRRHTVELHT
ncbi:uncharacterized protein F5147DRAFT_582695, partial [Suillus discolor]